MSVRRPAGDRGSGAVLGLTAVAVLGLATLVAGTAGSAALARHRAEKAADLGALAAAQRIGSWSGQRACELARSVVEANAASLESCRVESGDVVVVAMVQVPIPRLLGGGRAGVRASARAGRERGPASARPSVWCRLWDICGPSRWGA